MLLSLEPVWMPMTLRRIGGLAILLANSAEPAADFRSGPQIVAVDLSSVTTGPDGTAYRINDFCCASAAHGTSRRGPFFCGVGHYPGLQPDSHAPYSMTAPAIKAMIPNDMRSQPICLRSYRAWGSRLGISMIEA